MGEKLNVGKIRATTRCCEARTVIRVMVPELGREMVVAAVEKVDNEIILTVADSEWVPPEQPTEEPVEEPDEPVETE